MSKMLFSYPPTLVRRKKRHFGACSRTQHALGFNPEFLTNINEKIKMFLRNKSYETDAITNHKYYNNQQLP